MAITAAVVMVFVAVLGSVVRLARPSDAKGFERILVVPAIVTPGTTTDGHPMALLSTLQKIDGIQVAQRKQVIYGRHESGTTYLVSGEEHSGVELNRDFFPADQTAIDAWKRERVGAIVTEATAKLLNLRVGVATEIPTNAGPLLIKPIAITRGATFAQSMAVHFDYLQEATKNTETCGYRVFTKTEDANRVIHEIAERTKNSTTPAHGINSTRFLAGTAKRASTIPMVLGFLGAFLILTTALTLANNSSISIRERRTEIATLRVIGYHRRSIVSMLVGESVFVSLVGGAVAIILTWFLFRNGVTVGVGVAARGVPPVTIGGLAIAWGVVVAIVVPLVGTLPSAVAAARSPVVDGLRETA